MKRVLIVNDEPELIEICQIVLESAGYAVTPACGGTVGLEEAKHTNPDLIIVDWVMPDLSGAQVVKHLRSDPQTSRIPIVMMASLPEIEAEACILGVEGFLSKPFNVDDLIGAVDKNIAGEQKRGVA